MRKVLAAVACVATLAAPMAASAQRGGGFHGGGGGFHGGGFRGGGYRGGFRGGYGGYRGFGYGYRGFGYGYYGLGLGLGFGFGLGALYASDFYSPWYSYYPWSYGAYGGDYNFGGYGYGDGDVDPPAPRGYNDPWAQNYGSAPPQAGATIGQAPAACGRWVWNAQTSRSHWDNDNC